MIQSPEGPVNFQTTYFMQPPISIAFKCSLLKYWYWLTCSYFKTEQPPLNEERTLEDLINQGCFGCKSHHVE